VREVLSSCLRGEIGKEVFPGSELGVTIAKIRGRLCLPQPMQEEGETSLGRGILIKWIPSNEWKDGIEREKRSLGSQGDRLLAVTASKVVLLYISRFGFRHNYSADWRYYACQFCVAWQTEIKGFIERQIIEIASLHSLISSWRSRWFLSLLLTAVITSGRFGKKKKTLWQCAIYCRFWAT
jgi:hypothetical protein